MNGRLWKSNFLLLEFTDKQGEEVRMIYVAIKGGDSKNSCLDLYKYRRLYIEIFVDT